MRVADFRRLHHPLAADEHAAAVAVDPAAAVARIRRGLPIAEFDTLRELLGLTVEEMAHKIGVSVATLSRRRTQRQPLDVEHGDRIMRFSRLFWLAVELHDGDEAAARNWLRRPAIALGGASPLEFAETELGAREVEHLMGRIEHGVYT